MQPNVVIWSESARSTAVRTHSFIECRAMAVIEPDSSRITAIALRQMIEAAAATAGERRSLVAPFDVDLTNVHGTDS
jgi:hypothetical protein